MHTLTHNHYNEKRIDVNGNEIGLYNGFPYKGQPAAYPIMSKTFKAL